ncbi:hypothetical protein [Polaribacter sp.]|uniref:hypothetical protein n=1 Tax=Polaribacter sp. TaxID=1920175 RepID=UPI0025FAD51E|nr:hypothetical protein [Polaribacter sp.]
MIEPTYLRYVNDSLNKGLVNAENPAALPEGFIGLYEQEFTQKTPVNERKKVLNQLALWALFKGPVSTNLAASVLELKEEQMKDLVDTYSSWFNSPESGKYQLYHERIKVFLLSKTNDSLIQVNTESIISLCKQILKNSSNYINEFVEFSLKYYSSYLFDFTFFNPKYYQELKSYCLDTKFIEMNFTYLNSLNYFIQSIEYGLKISVQKNYDDDFLLFLEQKLKVESLIFEKLKSAFEYKLNDFVNYFLSIGLRKDEIFFKRYFLITLLKLVNLIKANKITQGHLETVFNGIRKDEYKLFFEDLIHVGSEVFWLKLLSTLEEKGFECSVILDHLPKGFNAETPVEKNYFSKNIQNAFDCLGNSDVISFIKDNLKSNSKSKNYSPYFSSIDDPIYFQDKLIELFEFSASNGKTNILINAIKPTTSKTHQSELTTLLINQSFDYNKKDQLRIINDVLNNTNKINYFKLIDRLKILFDKYLKFKKINSIKNLLKSLDRNSFEYYLEYCFEYFIKKNDTPSLNKLLAIEINNFSSISNFNENKIKQKLNYRLAEHIILNSKSISQLKGLDDKLSEEQNIIIKLQSGFLEKIKTSKEKEYPKLIFDFLSSTDLKDNILSWQLKDIDEKLNLSNDNLKDQLLNELRLTIHRIINSSVDFGLGLKVSSNLLFLTLENTVFAPRFEELVFQLNEVEKKIKSVLQIIEKKWNDDCGVSEDDYGSYKLVHTRNLEAESSKLQQINIIPNKEDVNLFLKNEIKDLKETLPKKYLLQYIEEIKSLYFKKLTLSQKIGDLKTLIIKNELSPIFDSLMFKLKSIFEKQNNLVLLYFLPHLNQFKAISKFSKQLLSISNLDASIIKFYSSVPSIKTITELISDLGFKKELYQVYNSKMLFNYNIIILQCYYNNNLFSPSEFIKDLKKLREEDLHEAYYYLGLNIYENNLTHILVSLIDKLYVNDFVRGLIKNIISNELDFNKYLKFLYFHFHSDLNLSDELIDEILLYNNLIKGFDFSHLDNLNLKINNIYTKNIFSNHE